MDIAINCNGILLDNVNEFKYLGLIINRACNSPENMLMNRIEKAQTAFNIVRCKSRLLGLYNRRVRIALV